MPIFLDHTKKRKNYFRTTVVIFSALIIGFVIFFILSIFFNKSLQPEPVKYADTIDSYHYYFSPANNKKIAITFDDGPRVGVTKSISEILLKNKVPGTFFFVGQNVLLQPNIVKQIQDEGFEIGNHSFTHYKDVHKSQNRLGLELRTTGYLINKITGETPKYYRPPFLLGIGVDPTVNPYISIPKDLVWTLENGLIPTGTDLDPKDWLANTTEEVNQRFESVLDNYPDGHILLLHEEWHTVESLQKIIDILKSRNYKIVTLEELLTPPTLIDIKNNLYTGLNDEKTNGEVSKLQWFLFKQGDLDPYLLTGVFGRETKNALTSFQLRNNLIDPNNINPNRAGVADEVTRNLIKEVSEEYLPVKNVEQVTLLNKVTSSINAFVISGYVNTVPVIRSSIVIMVKVALILVIIRILFILSIFIFGWTKRKRERNEELNKNNKWHGVTVLIPAYNEEENIQGTIESVLKSTYPRKEIIVIDDGSTDNTKNVVQTYIDKHPEHPIKLISVTNGGKSSALNHGIEISKFDICVVIDADAVLDQNALYYFIPHFDNPEIGAVAGRVNTTSNKGFLNLFQTLEYHIGQNIDKRVFSTLGAVGIVPGPAGAWRKDLVMMAGGFSNETLVEDQDMTLNILRMGKKIIYDERAISYTETPHNVNNFLKQRFRWIYGTIQCFWKNKKVYIERPFSMMSLVVMPNIFIFNILLPLSYPFADLALIVGVLFGEWRDMVIPFLLFTVFDILYAWFGVIGETNKFRLVTAVPLQRFSYRQLIYYTVIKSVVRAIEGTGSGWNKFAKTGETQRFYFSSMKDTCNEKLQSVPSEWMEKAPSSQADIGVSNTA